MSKKTFLTIRFIFPLLFLYFFYTGPANSQPSDSLSKPKGIRIIFAGDIMGHKTQIDQAWNPVTKQYEYDSCFSFLKPYFDRADAVIGNLEVTFGGPPYSGYPQFSSPVALGGALKNAGFDVLVTANNHAADKGKFGLENTLDVLDSLSFLHTGTFRSQEERDSLYPLIFEVKGIRIALLNYSYSTNGISVPFPYVVNRIDTAQIRKDLEKLKNQQTDHIIAFMHWGNEYERTANGEQKRLALFLRNLGVHSIIGSHPHVVQPIQIEYPIMEDSSRMRTVVWSLGNLVSNQRERFRNGGILVELVLQPDSPEFVSQVSYLPVYVNRRLYGEQQFFLLPPGDILRGQIIFDMISQEEKNMKQFYLDTSTHLRNIPEMLP